MSTCNSHPGESIPINDRGLLYGDGVFRTMKRTGGVTLCWRRHYRKLAADCAALKLRCPDAAELEAELAGLPPDCVAKIIVTRGTGSRGYAVTPDMIPTRIVSASPLPVHPETYLAQGVRLFLCGLRLASQPRLAGIKHLNRLENVLARMEWDDPGIAEGLLLDEAGLAIEGTMSNLFAYRGGVLHTPVLDRCGVAGVQRERILDAAPELGIPVRVAPLPLEMLMEAEEILLSNSIIGVWRVREFNGRLWNSGGLTAELRRRLEGRDD